MQSVLQRLFQKQEQHRLLMRPKHLMRHSPLLFAAAVTK
jgi:hypothetical protein